MRIVVRIVLLLVAVVLLIGAGVGMRLWRSVPPLSGRETLPALTDSVTITWDSLGVPHIAARSDRDAFAALGYVHARERLWQMETLRRAAEGRLSEIVGGAAVSSDRYLRSLDIARAAEASLAMLPAESRGLLDAYVEGINRWIAEPTRPLPPEFLILRFTPAPWTAVQSFEVARIMASDLASLSGELSLARAAARLSPAQLEEVMPWYPDSGATIVVVEPYARTPVRLSALPTERLALAEIPEIPALAAEMLEAASISRASNSWVIGPSRTASGKPILANDPHLQLRAPSIWFLATIESPGFAVSGVTIPGLPAIVIGHNRRIAWGLTNMEADDVDYVIERLSADSTQVQTPEGWRPVEVVRESIMVKGGLARAYTRRRTPNGPVVETAAQAPATPDSAGVVRVLALRWNAHTPSDELTAILNVNRAGTWDAFLAAVSGFKAPEQNWVYADVDGNIGYTASGNIPVRRSGRGLLPTAGWTGEGRWERFLRFEELPRVFNPAEGFIVTANNRIAGPSYPFLITASPALPYRAERIRELILARGLHTADDVQWMQMDTVDTFARRFKGVAADAADAEGRREVAAALRAWDGTMGADRTEPVVFWLWYRALQRLAYAEQSPDYTPSTPLHRWLFAGRSPWVDLPSVARRAMAEALPAAEGKTWGAVHTTSATHALGSVPALDRGLRLNVGSRARAGSLYTVNVADFGTRLPFTNAHAASMRMVVDLAEPAVARFILPTGQSGNPMSGHYRDQMVAWWSGRLSPVTLRAGEGARLVLVR